MSKDPEHHHHDRRHARCLVVTVSDSRALETDTGGALVTELLRAHGHEVVGRKLVKDEVAAIRSATLVGVEDERVDAVVLTGGTGISPRDVTPEAILPMLDRVLPGFGEAFRQLSFSEVGTAGILSRATAGSVGTTLVFAVPGSPDACRLAVDKLIGPLLGHALAMMVPRR
jgi:molybdopterin adenylyltransferase